MSFPPIDDIEPLDLSEISAKAYLEKLQKKGQKAFDARLAYEKNCIEKYDYPKYTGRPSQPPPKGERMEDYAMLHNTTVREMKEVELQVDEELRRQGYEIFLTKTAK